MPQLSIHLWPSIAANNLFLYPISCSPINDVPSSKSKSSLLLQPIRHTSPLLGPLLSRILGLLLQKSNRLRICLARTRSICLHTLLAHARQLRLPVALALLLLLQRVALVDLRRFRTQICLYPPYLWGKALEVVFDRDFGGDIEEQGKGGTNTYCVFF